MTLFEITHGERAAWQRRAAAGLARILDAHRDLPLITWTVGQAGATLVGQVHGLAPAIEMRRVFDQWRVALALDWLSETTYGTVYARAAGDRNGVRLALTATVFNNDEGEG